MSLTNNKFLWRPNDNGSLTNMRYGIEADKWYKAIKSAELRNRPTDFKKDLGAIGTFLKIPLILLFILFLIPVQIIKVLFNYNIKIFPGDEPTGPILSDREKFDKRLAEIRNKNSSKSYEIKPTHDMTKEEVADLVAYVKSETAKCKPKA